MRTSLLHKWGIANGVWDPYRHISNITAHVYGIQFRSSARGNRSVPAKHSYTNAYTVTDKHTATSQACVNVILCFCPLNCSNGPTQRIKECLLTPMGDLRVLYSDYVPEQNRQCVISRWQGSTNDCWFQFTDGINDVTMSAVVWNHTDVFSSIRTPPKGRHR